MTCWRGNKGEVVLDAVDIVSEGDGVLHDGEGRGGGECQQGGREKAEGG